MMSQYLYNKAILEKIAAEKKKSETNTFLQAAGIGGASAGLGAGIGYGFGKSKGNKTLANATTLANAARDADIQKATNSIDEFKYALGIATDNSIKKNFDVEHAREVHDRVAESHRSLVEGSRQNPRAYDPGKIADSELRVHKFANALREAEAKAQEATQAVGKANSNLKGMTATQEMLTDRANREAADAISDAAAKRLDTIKKYTKGGLGIGLGIGLGAYGAKKLYDKYKGREKRASYANTVLEKITQMTQDELQTQKTKQGKRL